MSDTILRYKNFGARIMEAERLTGAHIHGLPPGTPLACYPVDTLLGAPGNWMGGGGSYVVPVRPNKGLWFDWTMNDSNNTAILPTVKGCNPITGMPTSGYHLEKYENKCPKHGVDFFHGRFCPECNYKWPTRNYVSSPNTLWFDGFFNSKDGTVRQFFFTEDSLRDVASAMIGKENTAPAFGFAFYTPKEKRADYSYRSRGPTGQSMSFSHYYNPDYSPSYGETYTSYSCDCSTTRGISKSLSSDNMVREEVSIGAGAKIAQSLGEDTYEIDSWKDTPDAVMTIYFVFQEQFEEIKKAGIRDLSGKKEGMLSGVPVG